MKYSNIKGIVFDLDNTLYDEHLYFFAVFEKLCNILKCNEKLEGMKRAFSSLRSTSKDIFRDVLNINKFEQNAQRLEDDLFQIYISLDIKIEPYEDALYLLELCNNKNLKVGILTNGVIEAQKNKIRCLSISDYIGEVFFARQFGKIFEKPHRRSFEEISKNLKVSAPELIFIGDNPNIDFQGAKEINGVTIRLKRGIYKYIPSNKFIDIEMKNFKEVKNLL
jgi:putative hydrolase of the HAD superfamily